MSNLFEFARKTGKPCTCRERDTTGYAPIQVQGDRGLIDVHLTGCAAVEPIWAEELRTAAAKVDEKDRT